LQVEAVSRFDEEEERVVRSLLEGLILKHEARRWQTVSNNGGERKQTRMALDLQQERELAHALIDLLPPAKLGAVRSLLEVMVDDDDKDEEELTEEDRRALRASDAYFRNGGQGIPFEQVVADLGFTMEQIRGARPKE
jgi:hypothetical protein